MKQTYVRRLTVLNQGGLYARPCALIVKTVLKYDSELWVSNAGNKVSGRSIMGLLTLEAYEGVVLTFAATGPDALDMMEELTLLVNSGFGTGSTCLPIPKEHSEWVSSPGEPPPPAESIVPPPFRVLRVAFALGAGISGERKALLRGIMQSMRQRCLPRRVRVRGVDVSLKGAGETGSAAGAPSSSKVPEIDPPFFLLLCNEESRRLLEVDAIPGEVADLRGFIRGGHRGAPLSNEEISALVRCYPWNKSGGRYTLRAEVSGEERALLEAAFSRRNGYLRTHCLVLVRIDQAESDNLPLGDARNGLGAVVKTLQDRGWKCSAYRDVESFASIVSGALEAWAQSEGALPPPPGEEVKEEKPEA